MADRRDAGLVDLRLLTALGSRIASMPLSMSKMTKQLPNRPGWAVIVELAEEALERDCSSDQHRCRLKATRVQGGQLHLEIEDPNEASRGLFEAARAVSSEVCERCGGRGNPVGDGRGLLGCRCEGCRAPGTERLERYWQGRSQEQAGLVASAGSSGAGDHGTATNDGDPALGGTSNSHEEWYEDQLGLLVTARDDDRAMDGWTSNPGWAGLVRALVATLQAEHRDRGADAGRELPRLPHMKEKYGQLQIDFYSYTAYLWGFETFIEEMSGRICMHCGMPGECRDREWVRTECDACSAITEKFGRSRF